MHLYTSYIMQKTIERMIWMDNTLGMLLLFGGFVALIFSLIGIALYILFAVGLYGLAKNANTGNEWLAFIPIAQFYIIGKILREVKILNYTVPQLELVLPLAPVALMVVGAILGVIPILGGLVVFLLNIAYGVFYVVVLYNFYKKYKGQDAVLMTILSIVLPFMGPIYFFTMRNLPPIE